MKKAVVIGAGTMGNGIAHLFAMNDFHTSMVDINPEALNRGNATIEKNLARMVKKEVLTEADAQRTMSNLHLSTDLDLALKEADIAIEAATENESLKKTLFKQMDSQCPAQAILATNTSSISITRLAAVTGRPSRVIGMHFFNPVPVMKLVEVIRGYQTSPEVAATVMDLATSLGKVPLEVRDYPGFVSNRILMPMINEAILTLSEGIAGVVEIDGVMTLGMAHPMGPLLLADFIGLDVCLNIMRVLQEGFGQPKYAPAPLLINMVAAGQLGRKTGIGFYDYTADARNPVVSEAFS